MADHQQAAGVGGQEAAQPADRVGVQVVGRLVEQHGLRAGEQDPGQLDPAPLTARQGPDRLVQHPLGQPEAAGDPGCLRLRRVPAGRGQLGLRPRVRAHRLVPHLGRVVAHGQLGPPQPLDHRVQPAGGQDPVLGQHVEVTGPRVLRQVADLAGAADRAGRRLRPPRPGSGSASSCPAPLRPTSPILSPAATWKEARSSSRRAPARTSRSFATSICFVHSVSDNLPSTHDGRRLLPQQLVHRGESAPGLRGPEGTEVVVEGGWEPR